LASSAEESHRQLLNAKLGARKLGILAGSFIAEQQRVFYYARERAQPQVDCGDVFQPASPRLFGGSFDDAHRDGKLMHGENLSLHALHLYVAFHIRQQGNESAYCR
jgi:hypothetical protein